MNDKIKEIVNGKVGFVFNHKDRDGILDLITDLQQINKNLTNSLNKKVEEGIKLQQENDKLQQRIDKAKWNGMIYKSRNEKAIDKLNTQLAFTSSYQLNYQSAMNIIEETKSILQGSEKE